MAVVNKRQPSMLDPNSEGGNRPQGLLSCWVCIITNWVDLSFFMGGGGGGGERGGGAHVHIILSLPPTIQVMTPACTQLQGPTANPSTLSKHSDVGNSGGPSKLQGPRKRSILL